jgi:two-component system phosphate regulon sensor histidine kinase PhoR
MRQLKDAAAVRQQYTSNVTHELKTPVASISGASELIESGLVKAEDIPEFAHRIHGDATRLKDLVNDILMLSRLDESERMGDTTMLGATEQCDLLPIARDVARRLENMAQKRHVSITVDGDSATVVGHARLIDEIVNNLASNAVRYNKPEGSVRITVGHKEDQPFVRVSDTGIGIPEDEQEKVFARFYRVDTSRSRELGGTGLGLAIVKHAVALHHATIDLSSSEGVGTTITVCFPTQS